MTMGKEAAHSGQHRYIVIDVLRGVAILGMIWAHSKGLAPELLPKQFMGLLTQLSGAATPLFMLVAGTTIAILTQREMSDSERRRFRLEYFLRGVGLILLGLALLPWGGRVDVVLPYLGMTFVFATPFLFLGSKYLLGVSSVVFIASPILANSLRNALMNWPELLYWQVNSHPFAFASEWIFTGRAYHATWLLPFVLLGIVLGRLLCAGNFPTLTILLAGLFVTGSVYLLFVHPQNSSGIYLRGSYPEMTYDLGRALVVYSAGVALFAVPWSMFRRVVMVACAPITLSGRVPLTVYVFHVLLLFMIENYGFMTVVPAVFWPLIILVVCLSCASLWGIMLGVGPIERLLGVMSLRHSPRWAFTARRTSRVDLGIQKHSNARPQILDDASSDLTSDSISRMP